MNDTEKKTMRTSISLNPQIQEMVEKLIENKGYDTLAEVIKSGIRMLYAKEFPAYVDARRTKTPEEVLEGQEKKKQLKEESAKAKYVAICEALNGEIKTDEFGNEVCIWYTYDRNNRFEQTLPLSHMSEDLIASQYSPSKEDVEKRQKQGKVNY